MAQYSKNKEDYEDELDGAEYSSKSDFSKAEVVRLQVQKCNDLRSVEMKEGYFNYDRFGNKIYIPDSRKAWVSSVIALKNLLKPEITRDSSFKVEKFSNKEKELITKWGIKDDNGISYIPGLDEIFQVHGAQKKKGYYPGVKITKDKKGLHNHKFHGYWDDMVSLYDKMYAQLNILIDQCNYFKQEISY